MAKKINISSESLTTGIRFSLPAFFLTIHPHKTLSQTHPPFFPSLTLQGTAIAWLYAKIHPQRNTRLALPLLTIQHDLLPPLQDNTFHKALLLHA